MLQNEGLDEKKQTITDSSWNDTSHQENDTSGEMSVQQCMTMMILNAAIMREYLPPPPISQHPVHSIKYSTSSRNNKKKQANSFGM